MLPFEARCLSLGSSFPSSPLRRAILTRSSALSIRQEELVYLLQQLLALRLSEGTLWASGQPDPSAAAVSPFSLDASLPLSSLVRTALLRSPSAHLYELQPLFTDLLTLANLAPPITTAYTPSRHLVALGDDRKQHFEGLPTGFEVGTIGRNWHDEDEETSVVKLVLAALAKVGKEIGAGGSFCG